MDIAVVSRGLIDALTAPMQAEIQTTNNCELICRKPDTN